MDRLLRPICLVVALLLACPTMSFGGDLSLREQKVKAPEMGEITTYTLSSVLGTFAFVPPFEWRVGLEPDRQRVILTSKDRTASISVTLTALPLALSQENLELQRQVLSRFAAGRVVDEFSAYTSSHEGRGFDIAWTGAGNVQMMSRVAVFPTASGTLEFTLNAMAGKFSQAQPILGGLMTSFQQRDAVVGPSDTGA